MSTGDFDLDVKLDTNLIRQTIREEIQNVFNTPMTQFVTGMDVAGSSEGNVSVTYTTNTEGPPVWMNPNTFTVQPFTRSPMVPSPPPEVIEDAAIGPITYTRSRPDVEPIPVPEDCELLIRFNRHGHDLVFTFKGPTLDQVAGTLGQENIRETLLRLDKEFKLAVARAFKLVPVSEAKNKRMLILED